MLSLSLAVDLVLHLDHGSLMTDQHQDVADWPWYQCLLPEDQSAKLMPQECPASCCLLGLRHHLHQEC